MKLIPIILFISFKAFSQRYDSVNFIHVTLVKIERSFKVGNWLHLSNDSGLVKFLPQLRRKKEDKEGSCYLMDRDTWNKLLTFKN